MDNEDKIKELEEKNCKLEEELRLTKEHLKKYTAPESRREYYINNKDAIKERNKIYKAKKNFKSTPEQVKLYNQRAYLRRKEKLQKESNENI